MPHTPCHALLSRIHLMIDDIGYWWNNATPNDYGLMAIAIVVTAWFVSKYYLD